MHQRERSMGSTSSVLSARFPMGSDTMMVEWSNMCVFSEAEGRMCF